MNTATARRLLYPAIALALFAAILAIDLLDTPLGYALVFFLLAGCLALRARHQGACEEQVDRQQVLARILDGSPVICLRYGAAPNWPLAFVSDNITQWGYNAATLKAEQRPLLELLHADDRTRVDSELGGYTANGLDTFMQEYRIIPQQGEAIWVEARTVVHRDAHGLPVHYDAVLNDISLRKNQQETMGRTLAAQRQLNKRLEEAHNQLLQSEKMASIGQLAAGVAHELNNPIGFVYSNMGTLEGYVRDLIAIIDDYDKAVLAQEVPGNLPAAFEQIKQNRDYTYLRSDIFDLVSESRDGIERVRKIVLDLKSFSRVGEQEWQAADLHQGIESTLNIVWNELKYKCKINRDYGELPPVHCLISQLNQVFMNLLVNAGHAIETQGEITIRTRLLDEQQVAIDFCDTGAGIAPENLNRIFEPFFTTKPVGKGTGLGLSLTYSIIQRHHGKITVDSTPGQGTCFHIVLPIVPPRHPDKPMEPLA